MPEVLLDAAGRPRRCLASTRAARRATRAGARPPSRRSSPSCDTPVPVCHAARLRALIVVLWRAELCIHEALALSEADLDARRGSLLVRRAKGARRREVGMDDWAWNQFRPWLTARVDVPVGPLLCIATGPTRGRA